MTKFLVAALFLSFGVEATELDPVMNAPEEIIVREDHEGKREIYKVAQKSNVDNDAAAHELVDTYVKAENKDANVLPLGELDRVTSTQAWYYWSNNWYGYYWYGHSFYYRPYYSYYFGHYHYYYYRRWY